MITFRPLNIQTDSADMARLYNATAAEPISVETAAEWWTLREGQIRDTVLATDENGRAVGYRDVERETWMTPGCFFLKIVVEPDAQHCGLGAQMYNDALQAAREHGATRLESRVRENDSVSVTFAQRRGFNIERHSFESTLDLTAFDEHRFDDLMARVQADGFRFFTLAEAGVTDENKHKLYNLNRAASLDDPGNDDGTFPDFYAFSKNVFDASWFRADTQLLAAHGDHWAGLSAIGIYHTDKHAYNAFTGVMRDYRGRGLAQALKLQTILMAQREGMRYIRTHNDSNNAPMLAVNRKLGYIPEPGLYKLVCEL